MHANYSKPECLQSLSSPHSVQPLQLDMTIPDC
jgi:hypothetical protein